MQTIYEFGSKTFLYYYRVRYYDAQAGRLLNEDPSDFEGGTNFYTYAGNDPIDWFDPFGLERQLLNGPHASKSSEIVR